MVDGFDGIPVKVAAERLGVRPSTIQNLVKQGILMKIPITGKNGKWNRYHIDEASLTNYKKSQFHRVDKGR
jgi:hypothetical protein